MQPALRSVLDFHKKERPRLSFPMSPDSQHDLVRAINSRLTDTPESIIWVGQTLTKMFGDHLPKTTWSEWGIDLSYQEASDIRSLSQCPLILDNLDKLPPSRSTLLRHGPKYFNGRLKTERSRRSPYAAPSGS
jgi:hypothetical protein